MFALQGNIVDVVGGRIFPGEVAVSGGKILNIRPVEGLFERLILPGFVDAHVHVESSKMSPPAFGAALLRQGVLGTISDPHEIGNVCGEAGLRWMVEQNRKNPVATIFGVPSCIPATSREFETNGAIFDAHLVKRLLDEGKKNGNFGYLSEVMNFPGVISGNAELVAMIDHALSLGMPVDGHAPGLRGTGLVKYQAAGIQTDHESFALDEALEKVALGMKVIIREGSAAKNLQTLAPLLGSHPSQVMFCTDDCEPYDLASGQIDSIVRRLLEAKFDPIDVFRAASLNPIKHYQMPLGLLQKGDQADFIVANNLREMQVLQAYRNGKLVAGEGAPEISFEQPPLINNFHCDFVDPEQLAVRRSNGRHRVRAIVNLRGQLITEASEELLFSTDGVLQTAPERDIVKLVVLNRYEKGAKPQVAYVRGLGIQAGAAASTVAHDSHDVVAAGVDDESIAEAINLVIREQGGQSLVYPHGRYVCGLPIAGLMSDKDPQTVIQDFSTLERLAKEQLGSDLPSVFMALSFLSLLVIPKFKLSDKIGLFDGDEFKPVSMWV